MVRSPSRGVAEIEAQIRELTLLMYDTSVPVEALEQRVYPHLAPDIAFVDPWLRARGSGKFKVGLRGFHAVIRFDFHIDQLAVDLDEDGRTGRAIVEGVMNLRQIPFYTYPLRTILVYDLTLGEGGAGLQITKLEEMWSFGDMIANAPLLVGRFYEGVFRPAAGYFFTAAFWLSYVLFERRAPKPA